MDKNIFFLTLVIFSGIALAQPTPPHEVYGTVEASAEMEELTVEALNDGEEVSSVNPDEDGYYSIKIPSSYETVEVGLESGEKHEIDVGSASVTELDLEASLDSEETGGSSGGSSGGSGGGLGALPERSSDSNTTETVEAEIENETVEAQVQEIDENETVQVQVPENNTESTVGKVSFTSDQKSDKQVNVELESLGRETPEEIKEEESNEGSENEESVSDSEDSGSDSGDEVVYSYQRIEVNGVNDTEIKKAEINFEVNKSFLQERDRGPQEVVMERYNEQSWQELETRIDQELEDKYRYKASSTGFSYYAVKLEEKKDKKPQNLTVGGIEVEKVNQTANITIRVRNPSNTTLEKNLTIKENGRNLTEQISLRPLEDKNISITRELDTGNYTYTKGNLTEKLAIREEKDVTEEKDEDKKRPIPVLLLALCGTIITIILFRKDGLEKKIGGFISNSEQASEKEE